MIRYSVTCPGCHAVLWLDDDPPPAEVVRALERHERGHREQTLDQTPV
jgi:hypothetical protein